MGARSFVIAVVAALGLGAPAADAQRDFKVGVSGGVSLPVSDFNETHKPGFNGAVHVTLRSPGSPIAFRFEWFYNLVDNTDFVSINGATPELANRPVQINGAAINVSYDFGEATVRPYVIGGIGAYNVKPRDMGTRNDLAISGGVGSRFGRGGLDGFVEARLHTVLSDPRIQFVPLTVGVEF